MYQLVASSSSTGILNYLEPSNEVLLLASPDAHKFDSNLGYAVHMTSIYGQSTFLISQLIMVNILILLIFGIILTLHKIISNNNLMIIILLIILGFGYIFNFDNSHTAIASGLVT